MTDSPGGCETWIGAIINGSPIPQFVIGRDHRVIIWNEALEKYSGIKAEEVIGTNKHWKAFYPNERPCIVDLIVDRATDSIPEFYGDSCRKCEFIDDAYTATLFFADMQESGTWLHVTSSAIKDRDGRIVGGSVTLEDVSELRDVEKKLEENQRKLAEAMDLAHLVNWDFDIATNTFTFDNRFYSLYGSTEDLEGNKMKAEVYAEKFVHPDDRYLVAEEVKKANEATDPNFKSEVEHRIIRKDGEVRHIVVRFGVITDNEGRILGTRGANQDITGRKMAEEALRQANKKLNMLSTITRHDILNTIMVIRGYLELSEDLIKNEKIWEYVEKEKEAIDVIQRQIEFTKYYQDIGFNEPAWFRADDIAARASGSLDLKGIHTDISLDNIEIYADPLIERVFYNLIENSLRHGEGVTEISISFMKSADNIVISYRDNGVGINDQDRGKLFRRGFGKNTGLGLFLSREILAITGIEIAEKGRWGEGVNFEITVPKGNFRIEG